MTFQQDEQATRALSGTIGKRVLGVECPVRNKTGDTCNECVRVKRWWREKTAESEKLARDHQSKESYFLNILNREGDFTVLKIGKKVAKSLMSKNERYKQRTGKAFGFANLEEGEWVAISKEGDHPNFEYEFETLSEQAEAIDTSAVKELPSLNNLTADFNDGLLNIHDIASLSSGDSFEFRMLPIPTNNGKAVEMVFRYYHWRCSEADILGGEDLSTAVPTGTAAPKEFQEYMGVDVGDEEEVEEEPTQFTMETAPECFGHFDGDDDCLMTDCDLIREACAKDAGYVQNDEGEYVRKPKKKKKKK